MKPIIRHTVDIGVIQDVCGELKVFSSAEDIKDANLVVAKMRGPTIPHYHREATEFYFVLSGRGRLIVASDCFEIHKGSFIIIPPGYAHSTIPRNIMEVLAFSVPAWQEGEQIVVDDRSRESIYNRALEKKTLLDELLRRHIVEIKKGRTREQRDESVGHQRRVLLKQHKWDKLPTLELRKQLEVR